MTTKIQNTIEALKNDLHYTNYNEQKLRNDLWETRKLITCQLDNRDLDILATFAAQSDDRPTQPVPEWLVVLEDEQSDARIGCFIPEEVFAAATQLWRIYKTDYDLACEDDTVDDLTQRFVNDLRAYLLDHNCYELTDLLDECHEYSEAA